MKSKSLILSFCLLFLISCAGQFQSMSAVDKAMVVAQEITKTYLSLYSAAYNLTMNGTDAQKAFMKEKINPKLNEAKAAIIKMDKAVVLWKDTGIDSLETLKQQDNLIKLLNTVTQLVLEVS